VLKTRTNITTIAATPTFRALTSLTSEGQGRSTPFPVRERYSTGKRIGEVRDPVSIFGSDSRLLATETIPTARRT
jgi:hypothetical protein